MERFITGMLASMLLTPSLAFAETFDYAWLPALGQYQSFVDEDSEQRLLGNVLSGVILINTGRSSRWWVQGLYIDIDFDGTETEIGQNISGLEVAAIYQSRYRLSRHFKPWLGMGLSAAVLEFEDRYLTDDQGFLAQSFPDTQETALNLELQFVTDIDLLDDYETGISVRASIPTNDVLGKIEVALYIVF